MAGQITILICRGSIRPGGRVTHCRLRGLQIADRFGIRI
jgi:hypothetical protein